MVANPALYLDDFADEVLPNDLVSLTPEGWAKWLGKGGDDEREGGGGWQCPIPDDGEEFTGWETTFLEDIRFEVLADKKVALSRGIETDADFAAIRFGPGLGWSPEDILNPDESLSSQIADRIDDPVGDVGETGEIAVGRSRKVVCTYRADPPRLEVEAVQ